MKISVVVHPNAKKERIEKDLLDNLHVWVNEPPLEGKANQATTEALVDYFKTAKSNIKLISGAKSKYYFFNNSLSIFSISFVLLFKEFSTIICCPLSFLNKAACKSLLELSSRTNNLSNLLYKSSPVMNAFWYMKSRIPSVI